MMIYQKLLLSFVCVVLFVVLLGSTSYITNKRISDDLTKLTDSFLKKLEHSNRMEASLQNSLTYAQNLLTAYHQENSDTQNLNTGEDFNSNNLNNDYLSNIEKALSTFEQWLEKSRNIEKTNTTLPESKHFEVINKNGVINENGVSNENNASEALDKIVNNFIQYKEHLKYFLVILPNDLSKAKQGLNEGVSHDYQQILRNLSDYRGSVEEKLINDGRTVRQTAKVANQLAATITVACIIFIIGLGVLTYRLIHSPLKQPKETALKPGRNPTPDEGNVVTSRTTLKGNSAANNATSIIDSMIEVLIVVNPDNTIHAANRAAIKRLGYKEQVLRQLSITDIISSEENLPFRKQQVEQCIPAEGIKGLKVNYRTYDGTRLPMLLSCARLKNKDGKTEGIICIAQDLSQVIGSELQMKEASEKLIASNRELRATQGQLIQSSKLASIGEIATGIAHELNQPLGIIAMSADLQLNEIRCSRYENISESLQQIMRQVDRSITIINHLRTFGRESNKLPRNVTSINQIINDSLILINEQFRLDNIEVVKELSEDLTPIHSNSIQLEQVLTNILINAKDALNTVCAKRVCIRSYQHFDCVVVEVEDNGCGIPTSSMDKIFEPFFTSKAVGKGTGLGLSISYGIIKEHGGKLSVESIEGEGTTFRIELPAVEEVAA